MVGATVLFQHLGIPILFMGSNNTVFSTTAPLQHFSFSRMAIHVEHLFWGLRYISDAYFEATWSFKVSS